MKQEFAWRAEVLFLCGFTIRETATIINGHAFKPGPVNRIVTERDLAALRASERRVARLAELDAGAEGKNKGYVAWAANKSALAAATELGAIGRFRSADLNRVELMRRMDLPAAIDVARGNVPENIFMPERRRGAAVTRNIANCPLEFLSARGMIPEWAYLAGLRLREDAESATIGTLRSVDPSRTAIDGSASTNLSDAALDAMQRLTDARDAVAYAFRRQAHEHWAIIESVAILGQSIRETVEKSKPAMALSAGFLAESIEPAAYSYRLSPGGQIIGRMKGWIPPSVEQKERARAAA